MKSIKAKTMAFCNNPNHNKKISIYYFITIRTKKTALTKVSIITIQMMKMNTSYHW